MSARPIPPTSDLTAPYWEAARRGELSLQQCDACQERAFPPRAHCPSCGAAELAWSPVSGRGTVHSYTVAYRAPHPVFADQLPLVVAIVELEEGPRLVTNLVDCDHGELEVGLPVEVRFEPIDGSGASRASGPSSDTDDSDLALPVFTPIRGAGPTGTAKPSSDP